VLTKYDLVIYNNYVKQWTPKQVETLRKAHKLTRRALGEMVGVTVSAIYKWERGLKKPSKTTKILLSRIEDEFKKKGG
jgi:DNA-binding transcriptional regulator YiaG